MSRKIVECTQEENDMEQIAIPCQQRILSETIDKAISLCLIKTLTQVDVDKIHEVLCRQSLIYFTNNSQVETAFRNFISGHGFIKTGGFHFEFQRTNSFEIRFPEFTIGISDAAFFMLLGYIFGLIESAIICVGASVYEVKAGINNSFASCSIQ